MSNDTKWEYKSLEALEQDGASKCCKSSKQKRILKNAAIALVSIIMLYCTFAMLFDNFLLLAAFTTAKAATIPGTGAEAASSTKVPQYFQTSPELWAGPTATGRAPFLAQTNPVEFASTVTFVPNQPLETAVPIVGASQNQSIFQLMGQLSPYFSNPTGFGVNEYPLPPGANITQVQVSGPDCVLEFNVDHQ